MGSLNIAMERSTPVIIVLLQVLGLCSTLTDRIPDNYYSKSLESAVGDFTQSMYVHMVDTSSVEENFVFSPLSLHSALTLLFLGTKDNSTTQEQLGAAMGIVNSRDLLTSSYKKIIDSYKDQSSFLYGNHIWVGKEFTLNPNYKELVTGQFGSEVSNIDFKQFAAVEKINRWVKKKTNNKIEKLVESFSADTKLFLANALYFKENWLEPFEDTDGKGNIFEDLFDTGNGNKVKVPMLRQLSDKLIYGEIKTDDIYLEIVTIPYENEDFEMQIIVPKTTKEFHIMESLMQLKEEQDDKKSFNLFKALKNETYDFIEDVDLKIPKFKVESKFDASEALKKLGAREVFTSGAELDNISTDGPLGVSKVVHKAVVEVTKEGTEGAAATGVELVFFSASFGVQKRIVLDRPFIFIVQDKKNNIPILVGRVKNPNYP